MASKHHRQSPKSHLLILIWFFHLLLLLLLVNPSDPVLGCFIDNYDVRCDCSSESASDALHFGNLFDFYVDYSTLEFDSLIIENCDFEVLTKNHLDIDFGLNTLRLENVNISQVQNDAFERVKVINKFVHAKSAMVDQQQQRCPRFKPAAENLDYLAALNSLSLLNYLELCATNPDDSIPSNAFVQSEFLEQILFHGNFSTYTIETDAFSSQMDNLLSIVFERMDFRSIQSNAFDLRIRQNSWSSMKNFSTSIFFRNCTFAADIATVFDPDFGGNSRRPILLTIQPFNQMISIESLQIFETFLSSSSRNSLVVYQVRCGDHQKTNSLLLESFLKKYRSRIEIGCVDDGRNDHDHHLDSKLELSTTTMLPEAAATTMTTTAATATFLPTLVPELPSSSSSSPSPPPPPPPPPPTSSSAPVNLTMVTGPTQLVKTKSLADLLLNNSSIKSLNMKEWFRKLDDIIIHQKPDHSELLDFIEKIPVIFKFEVLRNMDARFKQTMSETTIKSFKSTRMTVGNDLIVLRNTRQPNPNGYYVVRTVIKEKAILEDMQNQTQNSNRTLLLNSDVISYNILEKGGDQHTMIHDAMIRIRFENIERRKFDDLVKCVYWNWFERQWLQDGCRFVEQESNSTITVCHCNHLTSFAVLLDISSREELNPDPVKQTLTYVCCGFSVFGLCVSILLICYMNREKYQIYNDRFRWRMNRYVITLNTAICLLATNFLTLFGLDRRENQDVCMTVSVVLLFFLLSSFCFMLLQGYHVFRSTMNPLILDLNYGFYYLFGYGLPTILILVMFVAMTINHHRPDQVLIGEFFCWISAKKHPYYFLIVTIPVAMTIIINIIFFTLLMVNLIRRSNFLKRIERENYQKHQKRSASDSKKKQDRNQQHHGLDVCRQTFNLSLLAVNLGITWILFLMYIADRMHYFSYIFIIINGSQGLFFMINQILLTKSKGKLNFKKLMNDTFTNNNNTSNTTTTGSKQTIITARESSSTPSVVSISISNQSSSSTTSSTTSLFRGLTNRFGKD